jgi:ribosomal protein S12 methylthiotransferase accessory factor
LIRRLFQRLDGTNDIEAILRYESVPDAFFALGIFRVLQDDGLIAEGPSPESPVALSFATPHLTGLKVRVIDLPGLLSAAMLGRLEALGARIVWGDADTDDATTTLVCPDGPDLNLLDRTNRRMQQRSRAWLPTFPLGDVVLAGPRIRPGVSGCFHCFERRWLGISPAIDLERAWLRRLRDGAWKDEQIASPAEADYIADLVAPFVARCLADPNASNRVTIARPESGSVSSVPFLAYPACELCGDPSRGDEFATPPGFAEWFDSAIPLKDLEPLVDRLANRVCGFAFFPSKPSRPVEPIEAGLPQIAVARFALPEPDGVTGEQDNWSHGSASSLRQARTLAVIEALERYTGLCRPANIITANYHAVKRQALLPPSLPLFSSLQYATPEFPFRPFNPARKARWVWGYSLIRKQRILVPATAAWYGHDDEWLGETSSGMAAHSSRGQALLNGALELVERDAFMIHWLHRLSPPLLDTKQFDKATLAARIVRYIQRTGYNVRLADLTTDLGIAVCLAIAFRTDRKKPALLLGAGAALDPAFAAERALRELYSAAVNDIGQWTPRPVVDPAHVLRLEDHSRAYEHPVWLRHADFLWASERRVLLRPATYPGDPLEQLSTLASTLQERGHDLIGVDITAADVAPHGIHVVRAIVPGLQPLGFGNRVRLGGRRLYEAPVRMGYHSCAVDEKDLNRIPHCFP